MSKVSLTILEPRGVLEDPKRVGLSAPRLDTLNGKTIALMSINIPGVFRCINDKIKFPTKPGSSYGWVTSKGGKASDCIECGQCEDVCPQHLPIRELLKQAAEQFE